MLRTWYFSLHPVINITSEKGCAVTYRTVSQLYRWNTDERSQHHGCSCPGSCVARSSAAILLTVQDKQIIVFHEERFQQSAPSQCWKIIDTKIQIYFCFRKWILYDKGQDWCWRITNKLFYWESSFNLSQTVIHNRYLPCHDELIF